MNDTPVYEWEDAINFIAERCNIDKDTIETVLTLEEDYMKSIGIIMEEQSNFEIDGQQREQSKKLISNERGGGDMEFKNKTELLDFEKQRENFISKEMVEIHRNSFSCYWQMLKYLFNKKI